jgi:hypothetical protein
MGQPEADEIEVMAFVVACALGSVPDSTMILRASLLMRHLCFGKKYAGEALVMGLVC